MGACSTCRLFGPMDKAPAYGAGDSGFESQERFPMSARAHCFAPRERGRWERGEQNVRVARYWDIFGSASDPSTSQRSTLAQRKRDGPITHRSLDRNQQVLTPTTAMESLLPLPTGGEAGRVNLKPPGAVSFASRAFLYGSVGRAYGC